jgi:hypothetical protein
MMQVSKVLTTIALGRTVFGLLLFHSGVVVDENESTVVVWV